MDHCNRHEDHDNLGSFTVLFTLVASGTESGLMARQVFTYKEFASVYWCKTIKKKIPQ